MKTYKIANAKLQKKSIKIKLESPINVAKRLGKKQKSPQADAKGLIRFLEKEGLL